ncbi:MAG: hypothetical protein LZF60_380095 [Nitrospira sp.]|nr:MAG: hypothetical protein LZF60_380095 [Nitrospira sp.]
MPHAVSAHAPRTVQAVSSLLRPDLRSCRAGRVVPFAAGADRAICLAGTVKEAGKLQRSAFIQPYCPHRFRDSFDRGTMCRKGRGSGPEADAPRLAIGALIESADYIGDKVNDEWLWPHLLCLTVVMVRYCDERPLSRDRPPSHPSARRITIQSMPICHMATTIEPRSVADVETGTGRGADPSVVFSDGQCLPTVAGAQGCG